MNRIYDEKLYFYLTRLMERHNISQDVLPTNIQTWQDFLERVSTTFVDLEGERYLLERSLQISSSEFSELYQRFAQAEEIANMGHWYYYSKEDRIIWSQGSTTIFGTAEVGTPKGYAQFLEFVCDEDKTRVKELVQASLTEGKAFECEMRIRRDSDHQVRWIYSKWETALSQSAMQNNQSPLYDLIGIVLDIQERKNAERKLAEINANLIEVSRKVGMSEIAASVLHNVGNVINSVNVSLTTLKTLLEHHQVEHLSQLSILLSKGIASNPNYFVEDKKGKLIPEYLECLSAEFNKFKEQGIEEIANLTKYFEHIRDITLSQKIVNGLPELKEWVNLDEICEQALMMSYIGGERNILILTVSLIKQLKIDTDKTKLLQILINLLKNAKESVLAAAIQEKKIDFSCYPSKRENFIEIVVQDNGLGISPDQFNKIFSMGYTTKKSGHGFGLHMCAIAAKEMGGELSAHSSGVNQGATFQLTLPIKAE